MIYGLKLWGSDGTTVTLDTNHTITRVLGTVSTGTSNGSATFPFTAAGGTPWWSLIVTTTASVSQRPAVTRSGDTLSWAFTATGTPTDCRIVVGVY